MSILSLWDDLPWLEDFEDEDLAVQPVAEVLTISAGVVWWSAAPIDIED
jgi:hypothetical protein